MKYVLLLTYALSFFSLAKTLPECRADQIQVRHLAIEAPGMSQTNDFYGLINISSSPCQFDSSQVNLVPVSANKSHQSESNLTELKVQSTTRFALQPARYNQLTLDTLVWFKVHGAGACDNRATFKQIKVTLPLLQQTSYTVPFSGYTSCGIPKAAVLKQGSDGWPRDCQYGDALAKVKKQGERVLVNQLANCG